MSDDWNFMIGHKILQYAGDDGVYAVQLTDPPYAGIMFSYGEVKFPEDLDEDEKITVKFEYDIIDNKGIEYDVAEFETYIGDLLIEIIMYQLSKNEIVYTGGTSENRDDNIIESDSE